MDVKDMHGVVQIDSDPMRAGGMRRRSTVIADPVLEEVGESEDVPPWRPREPFLVQIEMLSRTEYEVYFYDQKTLEPGVHSFPSIEQLAAFVRGVFIRPVVVKQQGVSMREADPIAEEIVQRAITYATNYRLANIDLRDLQVLVVRLDEVGEVDGRPIDLSRYRGWLR